MPEDSNHGNFANAEERLVYFTLPMALNYQRNSYSLWQAALKTYENVETKDVFDIKTVQEMPPDVLKEKLLKYKLALQPNKHTHTWQTISKTIFDNWGSLTNLFALTSPKACHPEGTEGSPPRKIQRLDVCTDNCHPEFISGSHINQSDFLQLQQLIQHKHKKGFPYLSGPKIFNYWSLIISTYGKVDLKNREYISIAPDTHIIQASVKLGVISQLESEKLTREQIAERWRILLAGSGINPIDMHAPLWFWSHNAFNDIHV